MPIDEPYFPEPTKRESTSGPYREATDALPTAPPRRVVVTRPEPADEGELARPRLSPDEVRALLAIETAKRPPWQSSARRSVVLVPIGILSRLLYAVAGSYSLLLAVAVSLVALAWVARPLFRRDGFT